MKIALCNEVLRPLSFPAQCELAAAMGYDALEVAPFTLAPDPTLITDQQAAEYARIASDHGLTISGLHWLLVAPAGLSIVSDDDALRARTTEVMERMVELCAAMSGRYLVHGSPQQRSIPLGMDPSVAWDRAADCFRRVAVRAQSLGLTYCLEPLARQETNFINTIEQAVMMVEAVDVASLKTMIDCSAAGLTEQESVAQLIERWMPTGYIAHVQVNDPNRRGPGQGDMQFAPILRSLHAMQRSSHFNGLLAVEPFDYLPNGPDCAAFSLGYLRGVIETIESESVR